MRRPDLGPALTGLAVLALAVGVAAVQFPRANPFTTDSESYLDVARNLAAGGGLVQRVVDFWRPTWPDPLGLWPPLYPAAIALASRLGIDFERAARLVPLVGLAVFALAYHALARRVLSPAGAWLALALTLFTPGVGRAAVTAWSEMPFLALATGALLALAARVGADPDAAARRPVAGALAGGLLAGLAALTRYVGWLLVPFGAAVLVACRASRREVLAWLAAAALPPLLWTLHNLAAFGRALGPGLPPSDIGPAAVAAATLRALRWGWLPRPLAANGVVASLALIGLGLGVLLAARRRGAKALPGLFAVTYLAGLLAARSAVAVNEVGDRYLTPAYPFLWLGALAGLALAAGRSRAMRRAVRIGGAALGLAAAAGFATAMAVPAPSAEALARDRELGELRRLVPPGDTPVLSDAAHRLRSATGRGAIAVPGARFQPRPFAAADEARWRARGVRDAVFRRRGADDGEPAEARWGPLLTRRLEGAPGEAWPAVDSTEHFIRYRLP